MKKPVTLAQLFTRPALRKRCLVALLTMAVAQGTGTLVINSKHEPHNSYNLTSRLTV